MELITSNLKHILQISAGCYGTDGYGAGVDDHSLYADLNAVVMKTTTLEPRQGNSGPTFQLLKDGNYWNNIGLKNPGIDDVSFPELPNLHLSLLADTDDEWVELFQRANQYSAINAYEMNLSCPAVPNDAPMDWERILSATDREVWLKINRTVNLTEIPSGISGLVCGNSISYDGGGLSGSKLCFDMNLELTRKYAGRISIIGCGGISNARHVQEYLDAGAIAVQMGTVFYRQFVTPE